MRLEAASTGSGIGSYLDTVVPKLSFRIVSYLSRMGQVLPHQRPYDPPAGTHGYPLSPGVPGAGLPFVDSPSGRHYSKRMAIGAGPRRRG